MARRPQQISGMHNGKFKNFPLRNATTPKSPHFSMYYKLYNAMIIQEIIVTFLIVGDLSLVSHTVPSQEFIYVEDDVYSLCQSVTLYTYTLDLLVVDNGSPPMTDSTTINVLVNNINQYAPLFERASYTSRLEKNSLIGMYHYVSI